MKRVQPLLIIFLLALPLIAQKNSFTEFEKAVRSERGGFAGNKGELSKVFHQERITLGMSFEQALWRYLGGDPERHFWIAYFLTADSYLHGHPPLTELGTKIRLRNLELLEKKVDDRSQARRISLNNQLAVSAKLSGNDPEAVEFRKKALELAARNPGARTYVPSITRYDNCILEAIESSVSHCDKNAPPQEKIINAGWMNGRARNFSNLTLPATRSDQGRTKVDVRIITDIDGNIITAEIIRGPTDLHALALDAARKLVFPPTELSGVRTKVTGWVSFDFIP